MLPLRRYVANATDDVITDRLLCLRDTVGDQRHEGVAFWALRGVVDVLGAHTAVLIQPLGGKIDGGRMYAGVGGDGDAHRRRFETTVRQRDSTTRTKED